MEGINKITARIIEDAEREIALMQQENEDKINIITAEAESAAEQESLELLARGRRAAEERRERLSSSAAVECRKLELAAKQELLGEAFDAAVEQLCSLPREDYLALIAALAAEAAEGNEKMLLNRCGGDSDGQYRPVRGRKAGQADPWQRNTPHPRRVYFKLWGCGAQLRL